MSYWTGPDSPESSTNPTNAPQSPVPAFTEVATSHSVLNTPLLSSAATREPGGADQTSPDADIKRVYAILAESGACVNDIPTQQEISAKLEQNVQTLRGQIAASEQTHGPGDEATLRRMGDLCWDLCWQNNLEAAEAVARHRVLSSTPTILPEALLDLSEILRCQGYYAEAEEIATRVYHETQPERGLWWSKSVESLVLINIQKGGESRVAESFLHELPEIQAAGSGLPQPMLQGRARDLMAVVMWCQGRLKEAETWINMGIRTTAQYPGTGYSLAKVLLIQARWGEAKRVCLRSLAVSIQQYGLVNLDAAIWMILAGDIFSAQGRWGEAEVFHNAALGILKRCLARNRGLVFDAMHSAFQTYAEQHKWARAKEILAECRHITGLSECRSMMLRAMEAEVLHSQGSYREAISIGREAQEYFDKNEPRHSPRLNRVLVRALQSAGELDEAEELATRILNVLLERCGPFHLETLRSIDCLARTAMAKGNTDDAMRTMRECVKRLEDKLGHEHYVTLESTVTLRGWERLENENESHWRASIRALIGWGGL